MDVYKSWPVSNMGPGQDSLKDLGLSSLERGKVCPRWSWRVPLESWAQQRRRDSISIGAVLTGLQGRPLMPGPGWRGPWVVGSGPVQVEPQIPHPLRQKPFILKKSRMLWIELPIEIQGQQGWSLPGTGLTGWVPVHGLQQTEGRSALHSLVS